VYFMNCSAVNLEKYDASGWTRLRDDRNTPANAAGYYLDGVYVPPQINPGCDFDFCSPGGTGIGVGAALEYVETGTRPLASNTPPPLLGITAANPARDIKTQPYIGKLRVSFNYAREAKCQFRQTVRLELEAPTGSCCPVSTSCSSTNAGGWAASADDCSSRAFQDGYFTPAKDVHGCDVLNTSTSSGAMCCGCAAPAQGAP
jgi:hypothetical protein